MTMRSKMITPLLLIVWTVGAALAAPPADVKPIAAIVSVTGTATVVRQDGKEEQAATGLLLGRGDVLRTAAGARVQLALNNGTGCEIEGGQTVTMPPPKRSGIRVLAGRAWQAVVAKFRSLLGSNTAQAVLAGTREDTGDPSLRPVQPNPTEGPDLALQRSKVLAERPVFLWTGVEWATKYHLCVQRRDGEGEWERVMAAEKPQGPAALVVAAPTDLPLEAGGVYRWYVWAEDEPEDLSKKRSERSSMASFQIATAKEVQEVQSALENLQSPSEKTLPLDGNVLQGILYEGHGFFADALAAYHRAWLKRPEDRGLIAMITDLRERSE